VHRGIDARLAQAVRGGTGEVLTNTTYQHHHNLDEAAEAYVGGDG